MCLCAYVSVCLCVYVLGVVTKLAGGIGVTGSVDGTGTAARFCYPSSVAVSISGTVYVADTSNHIIRLISPTGTIIALREKCFHGLVF